MKKLLNSPKFKGLLYNSTEKDINPTKSIPPKIFPIIDVPYKKSIPKDIVYWNWKMSKKQNTHYFNVLYENLSMALDFLIFPIISMSNPISTGMKIATIQVLKLLRNYP